MPVSARSARERCAACCRSAAACSARVTGSVPRKAAPSASRNSAALGRAGVARFAVAYVAEAAAVRAAAPQAELVLVLGVADPAEVPRKAP